MYKILLSVLLTSLISGCANNIKITDDMYGEKPIDEDSLVKNWLEEHLKDPDSARVVKYSNPKQYSNQGLFHSFYGYASCYGINSKNSFGGYTGQSLFIFYFQNNNISGYNQESSDNIFGAIEIRNLCNDLKSKDKINK